MAVVKAPPLIYGKVNAAESPADFVHKIGLGLKELRETRNCLKMIQMKNYIDDQESINKVLDENQLILIFGKSINTAKQRIAPKRPVDTLFIGYWSLDIGYSLKKRISNTQSPTQIPNPQ
jgi:hypothetical protein